MGGFRSHLPGRCHGYGYEDGGDYQLNKDDCSIGCKSVQKR